MSFRNFIFFFLFVICIAGLFAGLVYLHSFFLIKNIQLNSSVIPSTLRGTENLRTKNLLLTSEKEIVQILTLSNPSLEDIQVTKQFPNTLNIYTKTRLTIAALEVDDGYLFLSEEGIITGKIKKKEHKYPLIHYYQKFSYSTLQTGGKITYRDILLALHFIEKSNTLGLVVDTIDINGLNMILLHIGQKKIIFTTEKKKELQGYQLEEIIKKFNIEGKDFKTLDLRFEKPVVEL